MRRNWNLDGLYHASRERLPGKSRRIKGNPNAARLVPIVDEPECKVCGFPTNFNGHRLACGEQSGPQQRPEDKA